MSVIHHWLQSASPLVKTLMAISITTSLVIGHRLLYAPHIKEKKYREAEQWANMIIEQEESMQGTGDSHSPY